jgi:hypothetical protein
VYYIDLCREGAGWRADVYNSETHEVVADVFDDNGEECLRRARMVKEWYKRADAGEITSACLGAFLEADDTIPF